jgi:hypothetical protein
LAVFSKLLDVEKTRRAVEEKFGEWGELEEILGEGGVED